MSFSEAISSVFSKYADFSGRARRSEYWYFCLANFLITTVLSLLSKGGGFFRIVEIIYSLAVLIPGLAVLWRRLHDIGKSGANAFLLLIPIAGLIIVLIWLCTDSETGRNRFGANPKYKESTSDDSTSSGDWV